jgi:hypothetical protein
VNSDNPYASEENFKKLIATELDFLRKSQWESPHDRGYYEGFKSAVSMFNTFERIQSEGLDKD